MSAARAHVAPIGETKERFEIIAAKENSTRTLSCEWTWKSAQDRYKRFQQRFNYSDKQEAAIGGVGGEVGEMDELLSMMAEAREDRKKERSETRKRIQEKEEQKERLGALA